MDAKVEIFPIHEQLFSSTCSLWTKRWNS